MSIATVATEVSFPCTDGFQMEAYLARPEGDGPFPGMVMIFEATGMHREMKRLARDVAALGYAVILPNLFTRGNAILCISRLMKELKAEKGQGVDDLLAARSWLGAQTFVNAERFATIGFCLGGGFALLLAKTGLFKAAADFYGEPPKSLEGACPVYASYGDRDKVMMPHVPALEAELARERIPNDLKVYPGVGHSFMNIQPNKAWGLLLRYAPVHGGYNRDASRDAFARLETFLAEHV